MKDTTRAVHAGERADPTDGAVNLRIVWSTTYRYPEALDGGDASHIYTRYANPTTESVEAKLAALERSDGALSFASGMAAIQAVCTAFTKPGDTVAVQRGVYGGTTALMEQELAPNGVHIHVVDGSEPGPLPDGTTLLWLESITNPLLETADIGAWAEHAKQAGAKLCVDATFATPIFQRPLELGADVVVHSGTKYLGGHTDITSGFVCFQEHDRDALWLRRRNQGATLDPMAGYLLGRGMKTLPLRMARHSANAEALAAFFADHPAVEAVHHPSRDFVSGCGMVTIDLGSLDAAKHFRRNVRLMTPAASLGGVETLVSLPIETSHAYASAHDRARDGITDGLVRISVGLEAAEDLIKDAKQALA